MGRISRRAFIAASSAFAGALAVSSWVRAQESAFLKPQVEAGTLPPVADRLPANPLVITPFDRAGQQGGDWNHALVGGGSLSMLVRYQGY
ncbi:MAG TPA: twin-arginine translocation signal domain-containing protein, partial [Devosia sp.]|nr:twin-arginine translocation signal domain-containing protein [Devosia sp.]